MKLTRAATRHSRLSNGRSEFQRRGSMVHRFMHEDISPEFVFSVRVHGSVGSGLTRAHAASGLIVVISRENRSETDDIDARSNENSGSCS